MEQISRVYNLIITGGTFTEVHGSYHTHNGPQESGIVELSKAISTGAMYDSAMRYPAGRCHPGTREKIIESIFHWINDPFPSRNVLWLFGPAGSGKSAIMHTIAEKLHELYKERYGGSFFFAKGVPGREQGTTLFSTLAYQLATNFSCMREPINLAMINDPTLPTKSMQVQLKSLLVEPVTGCYDFPSLPPIIILDGLDECSTSRTQREILTSISNAITADHVPLRFLVASRPEFWIRDSFDRPPLLDITKQLDLNDLQTDTYQDIKQYLRDGFDDIYDRNLDIMGHIERPWPPEIELERLAFYSSGQFIYASTLLKFVGDDSDFNDPQKQLELISNPGSLHASAFWDLDQLYTRILSVYPRKGSLVKVLLGIWVRPFRLVDQNQDYHFPFFKFMEAYFNIDTTEVNLVLRSISSLIKTSKAPRKSDGADLDSIYGLPEDDIRIFHLSFADFLLNKTRSGSFSIDIYAESMNIFVRMKDILINSLNGSLKDVDKMEVFLNIPFFRPFVGVSSCAWDLFIDDLQLVLREFSKERTSVPTPLLLNVIRSLRYELNWGSNSTEKKSILTKEILPKIDEIVDECIRDILVNSSYPVFENIPYFFGIGGPTPLHRLAQYPGFDEESARAFLLHNAPLVSWTFRRLNGSVFRMYSIRTDVYSFLSSESRGRRFHDEFRSRFIRFCQDFLFRQEMWGDHLEQLQLELRMGISTRFLETHSISDLRYAKGTQDNDLEGFIETWCERNTKKSESLSGRTKMMSMVKIAQWLHRQLTRQPTSLLLNDHSNNLRHKMLNTVEHLYQTTILPHFQVSFHSNDKEEQTTWLSRLEFPPPLIERFPDKTSGIPPYNIRPADHTPILPRDILCMETAFLKMILWDELPIYPHITAAQVSTTFLEYYLLYYVTYLYNMTRPDLQKRKRYYDYIEGESFALWFAYADSTKEIQAALWTLNYLCSRENLSWRPPAGFCSGALDFLEKYALDQGGELSHWLEDLIPRQLRDDSHPSDWLGAPDRLLLSNEEYEKLPKNSYLDIEKKSVSS